DHQREEPAQEKERRDRPQVEQRDALVVLRQQPRLQAVAVVQIVQRRCCDGVHGYFCAAGSPSDLMYAMSCRSCSSVTSPLNVGIRGWNPATTFACGLRIDSRM